MTLGKQSTKEDISTWDAISQMLGYSRKELDSDFECYINKTANALNLKAKELMTKIKDQR